MLKALPEKLGSLAIDFYGWKRNLLSKLSNLLRLPRLSAQIRRRLSKPPSLIAIELFVAFSLALYYFFLTISQTETPRSYDGNEMNMYLFTYRSSDPYYHSADMMADFSNWEARLPGSILTGWTDNQAFNLGYKLFQHKIIQSDQIGFGGYGFAIRAIAFGFYHAAWLLLLFLSLILLRQDALLILVGIFSGLMYNFITPAGRWFYPWDMPSMFFFTCACLLYDRRRLIPLMIVVWLGGLFKETTLCCGLLILFGEHWSLKKRVAAFAITALVYLVTRKLLMTLYGVQTMLFALNNSANLPEMASKTWSLLVANVQHLFKPELNHVLFANAGVLFLILLIPWRTRRDVVFKIVTIAFIIGQFLFGIIIEFRIWYELLPLGWIMLSEAIANHHPLLPKSSAISAEAQPDFNEQESQKSLMNGSYWLVMGSLLVLALGIWGVSKVHPSGLQTASRKASSGALTNLSAAPAPFLPIKAALARRLNSARELEKSKKYAEALHQQRETVRLYPKEPVALNDLAWALAVDPVTELRNTKEAMQVSSQAVELTGRRRAFFISTLAAVYAEEGDFSKAVALTREARQLAEFTNERDVFETSDYFLNLFSAGKTVGSTVKP